MCEGVLGAGERDPPDPCSQDGEWGLSARAWAGRRRSHSPLPRPGEDNSTVVLGSTVKEVAQTRLGEPGDVLIFRLKPRRGTQEDGREEYH